MNTEPQFTPEVISFIRKSGELSKLLRRSDRVAVDALKFLEDTMNDEKADLKLRVACAKEIVGINIDTAKIVNQDNLQRMVAQLKLNPGQGNLVEKDSTPVLDFDTVGEF